VGELGTEDFTSGINTVAGDDEPGTWDCVVCLAQLGCCSAAMGEEPGSLPWDPLREQDWNSLGAFDESVLEGVLWEGAGDGVVGKGVGHAGCDGLDIDENGMHSKGVHADQFSPMTIDAQFDCFWDNFPGQGLDTASSHGNLSGHDKQVAEARPQMSHVAGRAGLCGAVSKVTTGADCRADATTPRSPKSSKASARALSTGSVPTHLPVSGAVSHSAASGSFMGMPLKTDFSPGQLVGGEMRHNVSLPAADGSHLTRVNDKDMLVVPFFVIAITEGRLMQTPNQLRATLEQVHRKVSKEQNTVVQVPSEGGVVDLKLRVFAATSSEAGAIDEYIAMHANQVPAPFVVLHKNLYMGVAYDAATLDLSVAIVADRLRKKVKTHAVKILREAIGDARCRISSACLYGQQGAMAPLRYLQFLVDEKMTPLDEVLALPGVPDISRMIIVPTKKPRAPREDMKNMLMLPGSISGFPGTLRQANLTHYASIPNSLHAHINGVAGSAGARGHHSPDASQPSTPGGHVEDDASSLNGDGVPAAARLSAYFPVSLFVTAIADGQITSDAPPKVAERLSLIVRKVPKEQNTSVEISDGTGTVPLQMRVFVVNSEDAKAVGDYINNHITQVCLSFSPPLLSPLPTHHSAFSFSLSNGKSDES